MRTAKWITALVILALAGCVHGTPFEPEMCIVTMDSSGTVMLSAEMLDRCRTWQILVEIRRP